MLKDNELYQLIPQRPPIVMVDALWWADENGAETGLTIKPDNIFVENGIFREPGVIEHIAQSAAAMAGYATFKAGLPPKLGFIGEIKKCRIYGLPQVGMELRTTLSVLGNAAGVTLVGAKVVSGSLENQNLTSQEEHLIADCQMKIFIKE